MLKADLSRRNFPSVPSDRHRETIIGIRSKIYMEHIMNTQELKALVYRLGEHKSVLTAAELLESGANLSSINKLVETGILYPSAEGIYMPENADFGERHSEVEVTTRFPNTVICLDNALNFHNLTTQRARKVWAAYRADSQEPIDRKLPIYSVRMSDPGFSCGIETHIIEGLPVKVYSQAKTVADCFNYQELTGIDVAVEAFEQAIREKRCTVLEITDYIEIDNLDIHTARELERCVNKALIGVS